MLEPKPLISETNPIIVSEMCLFKSQIVIPVQRNMEFWNGNGMWNCALKVLQWTTNTWHF